MANKLRNIEIFNGTQFMCSNCNLKESIRNSLHQTEIISETEKLNKEKLDELKNRFEHNGKIVVSKKKSFEAARQYVSKESKDTICVLNFASATNAGGGVSTGSNAQEEDLCRCSTLYKCLNNIKVKKQFHFKHKDDIREHKLNHLYNNDCIYTPGVTVIRDDTNNEFLEEQDFFNVDIISCAAPNLKHIKISDENLFNLHKERLERILDIALLHNVDIIILGAFGCGAFNNNPKIVAQASKEVIKHYTKAFKTIEFAVYCGKDKTNFNTFLNTYIHD